MRKRLNGWMTEIRDVGCIPEWIMISQARTDGSIWRSMRRGTSNPLNRYLPVVNLLSEGDGALDKLGVLLDDPDPVVATGQQSAWEISGMTMQVTKPVSVICFLILKSMSVRHQPAPSASWARMSRLHWTYLAWRLKLTRCLLRCTREISWTISGRSPSPLNQQSDR